VKRFKNILLVYDDTSSGAATLGRAVDLAGKNQARLTVIRVIKEIPRDYQMLITTFSPGEVMQVAIKNYTQDMEAYLAKFHTNQTITTRVVAGEEFIEIIKEVLHNDYDLVIKTAQGMGGKMTILFGSTAMHLLRKCPCPVLLLKPGQQQQFDQIMVAVDVVPAKDKEIDQNNTMMELATSLARMEGSELSIVHAWSRAWEDWQFIAPEESDRSARQVENIHIEWMDDLLKQSDLQQLSCQQYVVQGQAEEVIPEFAKQHKVDIIVMATVSHTDIPGFFMGNIAEEILHKVNCSVLAIKPAGFVSPVQRTDN
jgi:universal stress protein E